MTTKRFDIDDSDIVVDDLQTGESYIFDDYRSCENCCNLLNALSEENEQLKNICKNLIHEVNKRGITVTMTDNCKELLE